MSDDVIIDVYQLVLLTAHRQRNLVYSCMYVCVSDVLLIAVAICSVMWRNGEVVWPPLGFVFARNFCDSKFYVVIFFWLRAGYFHTKLRQIKNH